MSQKDEHSTPSLAARLELAVKALQQIAEPAMSRNAGSAQQIAAKTLIALGMHSSQQDAEGSEVIAKLKQVMCFKTGTQLADHLGVSRLTITQISNGHAAIGPKIRNAAILRCYPALAASFSNEGLFTMLVGRELVNPDGFGEGLLDACKKLFRAHSDEALAGHLGFARNTISAIRYNRTTVGMRARMLIYAKATGNDMTLFMDALETNTALIKLLIHRPPIQSANFSTQPAVPVLSGS